MLVVEVDIEEVEEVDVDVDVEIELVLVDVVDVVDVDEINETLENMSPVAEYGNPLTSSTKFTFMWPVKALPKTPIAFPVRE